MNDKPIEQRLREFAPTLPPLLRNRVLDSCVAKAQKQRQRDRRANWRLAWGFAAVCALHFGVGGILQSQQNALIGVSASPDSSPRFAANPADVQGSLVLRSQLLAELSDPRRRRTGAL